MENDELKIEDLIPYLNTTKTVFYHAVHNGGSEGEWIEGTIHGINLVSNEIYFLPLFYNGDTFKCQWFLLFFRFNKNRPKKFRVKLAL